MDGLGRMVGNLIHFTSEQLVEGFLSNDRSKTVLWKGGVNVKNTPDAHVLVELLIKCWQAAPRKKSSPDNGQ